MAGPGSIALVQFTADDQDAGTPVVKHFSFVLLSDKNIPLVYLSES